MHTAGKQYRCACAADVTGRLPADDLVTMDLLRRSRTPVGNSGNRMVGPGTQGSFVVRIWLEGESIDNPIWRGHIRHVQGEEEEYFQDLMEMREFLGRVSETTGPSLTAQRLKNATKSESGTVTDLKRKD
jgi:hypothetical protein